MLLRLNRKKSMLIKNECSCLRPTGLPDFPHVEKFLKASLTKCFSP